MKKMYLSLAVLFVAAGALAQGGGPVLPANGTVHAKNLVKQKPAAEVIEYNRGGSIWSDDFSGTVTWQFINNGDALQDWVVGSTGPTGGFSAGMGSISSTSGGNFAMFDSDGIGFQGAVQDAIIYYGPIDLSSEAAVSIVFESYYRNYQGQTFVVTSTDGVAWDETEVHANVAVNASTANPEVVTVNVSASIGGSSTAYIGFKYFGSWDYAWMVDDVSLIVPPPDELSLYNAQWQSQDGIPYTIIPSDQSSSINNEFTARITNTGSSNQTGVTLDVTITDGGGTGSTVYSGASVLTNVNVSDDTLLTSATTYSLGTTVDDFVVDWEVNYPNLGTDDDPSNNTYQQAMSVSANEFGRDNLNNFTSTGGLWNGAGNAYVMGPEYDMYTTRDLSIIRCALGSSTVPGVIMYGQVYEVDTATGDFNLVYDGSGTADGEFEVQNYMISSGGVATWVNIPIQGGTFTMSAGNIYIVCVGHYGGPDDATILNGGITAPEQTVFILDGTDNTWYYMTSTPAIRAVFSPETTNGIEEESASLTLQQNVPNPFNGTTTINYSLVNQAKVTFEITDISGKTINRMDLGARSAGEHNLRLNAADYSQGVYFYTLTAGAEKLTKRMIVTW